MISRFPFLLTEESRRDQLDSASLAISTPPECKGRKNSRQESQGTSLSTIPKPNSFKTNQFSGGIPNETTRQFH
jgi:hypothetical protein